MATGSEDYTVKLRSVKTGILRHTLEHNYTSSVPFSPDRKFLPTGDWLYRTVKLLLVETNTLYKILEANFIMSSSSITFSSNGRFLATASSDHTAKLWEVKTGILYKTLVGHKNLLLAIAFSVDNQFLVTGGYDNTPRLGR